MNAHADKHLLRVLVVDDNALNLSVLTRLLKKKFSDILDGPPVAVDSGLKALQLLRSNVFDVILMDIEMPFLSGVDCTKRIRAGQDGVLQINRTARIVAVTTAVGDEPEILYRRTGFDGLIGKPVVYDSINELLAPLSSEATSALGHDNLPSTDVEGQRILGPLPPMLPITLGAERLFFLPSGNQPVNSPAPEITKSSDFELLLREQTRTSLRQFGACAMTTMEATSGGGVSDRRTLRQYDDGECATPPMGCAQEEPTAAGNSIRRHASEKYTSPRSQTHTGQRHGSMTISQQALYQQLEREMEAARVDVPERSPCRPAFKHRHSDPADVELAARRIPPLFIRKAGDECAAEDGFDDYAEVLSPSDDWSRFSPAVNLSARLGVPFGCYDRRGSNTSDSSPGQTSTGFESSPLAFDSAAEPHFARRSDSLTTTDDGTMSDVTTPESDAADSGESGGDGGDKGEMGDRALALPAPLCHAVPSIQKPPPRRPSFERHDASLDIRRRSDGDQSLASATQWLTLA